MSGDAVFLLLQAGVVDHHGNAEGDHEQYRQRQQAGDECDHQGQGQGAIEPQQLWPTGIRELRHADLAMVHVIAGQVQFAQARTLALAVHIGNGQDSEDTEQHGRDHRHEDVRRVHVQGTGSASGRPAPGRHVHHPAGEDDQAGHDPRAHAQAAVQRQHGGHADHVGGGAVAVEGDDQGQGGGAHGDLQRVALDQLEDLAHGRVEQAGVDHQGEVEDGEHQHHAGGRQLGDAFEHHGADLAGKATEQSE
ncbi:hypothetical protein D3C85_766970 [compost metagenome]